jgi:hypothetical protein
MVIGSAGTARADFIGTLGLSNDGVSANSTNLATATSFTFATASLSNPTGTNQLLVASTSGDYSPIPKGVSGSIVVANGALNLTGPPLLTLNITNGTRFTPPPGGLGSYGTFKETSLVFHTLSNPAPNTVRETVYLLGTFTPTALLGQPSTPFTTSLVFTFDQVGGPGGSLVGQATLITPPSLPEPSAVILLGIGGALTLAMRRRLKSKA